VSLTPSADAADVAAATARRHLLNGDGHLGPAQRVAYLLLNARRNRLPYSHVDSELTIVDFHCAMALERLDELPGTPSPSRALSDLFWMHLPWQRMVRELGPLHVLDLGCGSGQYGERLPRWSEGRIVRYVGVDLEAHRDWPRLVSNRSSVEFHAGNIEDIDRLMPADTNVIVSQSAMEHVTNDMRVFEHVHAYAHRAGRPLLQIHLLPSAACLWLYLWHGYRQYTPRRLTPITTLFADCSQRLLVRLGGSACNALHLRWITWPVLVRRTVDPRDLQTTEYRRVLAKAIAEDMRRPQLSPAFYALLVQSNVKHEALTTAWWTP